MKKKIYKTPTSRIVVLGPDEVMATQGGGTGSFTGSEGTWAKGSSWEDEEDQGATWDNAGW